MSKKNPDFDDDDDEDLDLDDDGEEVEPSAKEIAELRAKHKKLKAFFAQSAGPSPEEELRRTMGDEKVDAYMRSRERHAAGERRRKGIKDPPQSDAPKPAAASEEEEYPEIMTIEQVADYMQLHPQVIYRHIRAGTIPVSRIGRTIRIKKSILDAFLETGAWKSVGSFIRYMKERGAYPEDKPEDPEPPRNRRQRFSADVD